MFNRGRTASQRFLERSYDPRGEMNMPRIFLVLLVTISTGAILDTPGFTQQRADADASRDQRLAKIPSTTKLVSGGWKGTFSPDGTKLAYGTKDRSGLVLRDLRSGEVTEIVEAGKDATWSPDGKWIAFVKEPRYDAYTGEEIWLLSPEDGATRKLADGGFPQWSSDGKKLFFHSRKKRAIYAISVDQEQAEPELFYDNALSYYPAISPDEKQIAFGRGGMLTIVDRETGDTVLTWPTPGARGLLPAWSPDGTLLAFGGFNTDQIGVWVLDPKRKRARRFVKGAYTMPCWSPDGSKLLFDYRDDEWEIWSIDVKMLWALFDPKTEDPDESR
jgi:Tol biopolymer transport system component